MRLKKILTEKSKSLNKKIEGNNYIIIICVEIILIIISFIPSYFELYIFPILQIIFLPFMYIIWNLKFKEKHEENKKLKDMVKHLNHIYNLINNEELNYFRLKNKINDIIQTFIEVLEFNLNFHIDKFIDNQTSQFENNLFSLIFYNKNPLILNTPYIMINDWNIIRDVHKINSEKLTNNGYWKSYDSKNNISVKINFLKYFKSKIEEYSKQELALMRGK